SMMGLTGYPIRNCTPSRFKISAITAAAFTRVSSTGIGPALRNSTSFAANDLRSAERNPGRLDVRKTGSARGRRGAVSQIEVADAAADDECAPRFRDGDTFRQLVHHCEWMHDPPF